MVDQKLSFHLCLLSLSLPLSPSLPLSLPRSLFPLSCTDKKRRWCVTAQRKPSSSNRNLCVLPKQETHLFLREKGLRHRLVFYQREARRDDPCMCWSAFVHERFLDANARQGIRMCSRMVSDPTNVNGRTRHSVGHIVHFVQQDKLLCTLCDTRV